MKHVIPTVSAEHLKKAMLAKNRAATPDAIVEDSALLANNQLLEHALEELDDDDFTQHVARLKDKVSAEYRRLRERRDALNAVSPPEEPAEAPAVAEPVAVWSPWLHTQSNKLEHSCHPSAGYTWKRLRVAAHCGELMLCTWVAKLAEHLLLVMSSPSTMACFLCSLHGLLAGITLVTSVHGTFRVPLTVECESKFGQTLSTFVFCMCEDTEREINVTSLGAPF